MDIRTGKTYESKEAALADGVPVSDFAEIQERGTQKPPKVTFSKGSFKKIEQLQER